AELLKPFNVDLLVCDPYLQQSSLPADCQLVSKDELLRRSDIVSVHASRLDNKGVLIETGDYSIMKTGAILVNLSRGGMIDEEGLIAALRSGQIAGAGLDVFGAEPYQGPLCEFENVILTPHSATLTVETRVAMEMECAEKSIRFLRGDIDPKEKVV
ncbi:MAG: hypothetical protein JO301_02200, partial [Chitinophagaceae bacterium]|nr:hypothetical protein [Chitinophagaceae bacterium]